MFAVTRNLVRSPALRQGIQMMQVSAGRQINMKVVSASSIDACRNETMEEKNKRLGRAMSPHLSIYKIQLTSALSITHRATGAALSVAVWALGIGALVSSHDIQHYITMFEGLQLNDASLTALKFTLTYPLAYHTANGIRHLLWDSGRFLKIKEVYLTGYAMLFFSFLLAGGLTML